MEAGEGGDGEQRRLEQDVRATLAWINTYLRPRACTATALEADFGDGVRLIILLEMAFNTRISYNARPKLPFHCLDNLAIAFQFCAEHGICLLNLDPHSILNGAVKPTLNLFRSILRTLTLQELQDFGTEANVVAAPAMSVRTHLLEWAAKTFAQDVPVSDLWTSFADGVAFCALIESLVPGSIDLSRTARSSPAANLALAFSTAEAKLGIPSILKPEDFSREKRADEAAVEQYLSMLVSAAAGNRKRNEVAQEQLLAIKAKKEKEVDQLKTQMIENEKRMELIIEANEIAASKEKFLQDRLENENQALDELKAKYSHLLEHSQKTHEFMQELASAENALRSHISELDSAIEKRDFLIGELQNDNARLNAEIYAMHTEAMDVQYRFLADEHKRVEIMRLGDVPSPVRDKTEVAAKEEPKVFAEFFASLPSRRGWLMLRKIGGGFFTKPKLKKRYFELRGDCLLHSKKKSTSLSSCKFIKLSHYQKVEFETDAVDVFEDFRQMLTPGAVAQSATDDPTGDQFVLRLIPKPHKSGLNSYELVAVQSFEAELREEILLWVQEINDRIALHDYIKDLENGRVNSCRELVDFVADPARTLLQVSDRLPDLHRALLHFKESLIMRRNLAIVFDNVALSPSCLELLGEIIAQNTTIRVLELPRNQIGARELRPLIEALKLNRSLSELSLVENHLKDEGCALLADAIAHHPRLRIVRLAGNAIRCQGVVALCNGIQASSDRFRWEHVFSTLDLGQNCVGDRGATAIADLIKSNRTITRIRLNRNIISDIGLTVICAALQANPRPIEEILLAQNQLTSRGVEKLADALQDLQTPHIIDLSRNQMIGRSGIARLLQVDIPIKFEGFAVVRGINAGETHCASITERPEK